METRSKTGPKVDEETNAAIYQGCTINQLCEIFKMDARDLKPKIEGQVRPVGIRRNAPIYAIRDVAPYLVKPPYDIDEFIQRMSIADLPPILRKEYWAGLRSRQLYEKEAAELWPTSDVVDIVSTLFKTIRMSLLLTRETVEREAELSPTQRQIITRLIDNTLEDAYAKTARLCAEAKQKSDDASVQTEQDPGEEDL